MLSTEVPIAVLSFSISQTKRVSILWHDGRRASCKMRALMTLRLTPSSLSVTNWTRKQIARCKHPLWSNGAARTVTSPTMRHRPLRTSLWTMPSLRWPSLHSREKAAQTFSSFRTPLAVQAVQSSLLRRVMRMVPIPVAAPSPPLRRAAAAECDLSIMIYKTWRLTQTKFKSVIECYLNNTANKKVTSLTLQIYIKEALQNSLHWDLSKE